MERQAILDTIRQLKGDKLMAARLLGIGKTTLYRKLKEYGSEPKRRSRWTIDGIRTRHACSGRSDAATGAAMLGLPVS